MNREIHLKSRPDGEASADNFIMHEAPMPVPDDGGILLKLRYISVDPYLRGRMNDGVSYVAPFELNKSIESGCIGEVTVSSHPLFKVGDILSGYLPWQDFVAVDEASVKDRGLQKIDTQGIPMTHYLGLLGMPGQTAWVGLKGLGQPKAGETVFVSAASGAVGSVVGQIAKQFGCRVVGAAGSDDKVAYLLNDLKFDAAFNYKTVENIDETLKQCCPDGIDVNYENVGGPVSDAVFENLNTHGRMIICGLISRYQTGGINAGPPLMNVLVKSLKIQGFIVSNYPELCAEWVETGKQWFRDGKLITRESMREGLESAPDALMDVLAGRNFGKHMVKL